MTHAKALSQKVMIILKWTFFRKFLLFFNLENVYLALYLVIIQIEFATEKSVQPCWKCYCDGDDKFFSVVLRKYHIEKFWVIWTNNTRYFEKRKSNRIAPQFTCIANVKTCVLKISIYFAIHCEFRVESFRIPSERIAAGLL